MYIWGFRACQHLSSLVPVMNDYGWEWLPNDIRGPWGLKLPDICITGEEKTPKNPHPGNLSRPGIEPGPTAWQARMLPPVPQRCTLRSWRWNLILCTLTVTLHVGFRKLGRHWPSGYTSAVGGVIGKVGGCIPNYRKFRISEGLL